MAGFGVALELVSDLSRGIMVSEMAEYWEKVQCTSARPHVDLIPGGNGTGTHLTRAHEDEEHASGVWFPLTSVVHSSLSIDLRLTIVIDHE